MENFFQKEVDKYIKQFEEGYWSPLSILAALTEEVGELAREINHLFGEKRKKRSSKKSIKNLEIELGDLLFTLCCIANKYGIDLEKALKKTIEKYNKRDINRWKRKSDLK